MINKVSRFSLILSIVFTLILIASCNKKDKIDSNPGYKLTFSSDTVFFDTVFTTVGSITQRLIVHNDNPHKVVVSSIRLAGQSTAFTLNIDGIPSSSASNIEIAGNDSIFVFVRATLNPNNQSGPLIITDSIMFHTNGNQQKVQLVAWGQDAIFYKNVIIRGITTWDSIKPHVIYGSVRVDTGSTLVITPGTHVYFHKSAYLAISHLSTLDVEGNLDHPVQFLGDRLDPFYKDLPGQWEGILLEKGSHDNKVNYAIIKNGYTGISVDSASDISQPVLNINNTIIRNMAGNDIYARASNILSTNCVFGDCAGACLSLNYGGSYDFRQTTIANYWSNSIRFDSALYLSNYSYDTLGHRKFNPLINAYFGNVIVYGQQDGELNLDGDPSSGFSYKFENCLLKTHHSTSDPSHFISCVINKDPEFIDVSKFNYQIDSISPAIGHGSSTIQVPMLDILGYTRTSPPDIGAYQYVP